jgi:hypothetical protein
MRNDPDRARAVAEDQDPSTRDQSPEHSDRNALDVVRQGHRLAGFAGETGRSSGSAFLDSADVAFYQLNEAYQLLRDDEPIDWNDPEWLTERTRQLRSRITHASELEHAVLEYRDALYQAGVLQRRIQRHDAALHRRVEIERLRADGTLYREAHRNQNRPAHVDVDPGAWATVKREAVRLRETVGAHVGGLVVQFTDAGVPPSHSSVRTSEHRFARLCVDDDAWAKFRGIAIDAHVSTSRLVGLVAEAEAVRLGWRVPGGAR